LSLPEEIKSVSNIRRHISRLSAGLVEYIKPFYDKDRHLFSYTVEDDGSPLKTGGHVTSTATCIFLLKELGKLGKICASEEPLIENLLKAEWTSANLPSFNPYTVGVVLPCLHVLGVDPKHEKIQKGLQELKEAILIGNGGISLTPEYENTESAFLTYWGLESLTKFKEAFEAEDAVKKALSWAQREVYRQITFFKADTILKNVHQLGFAWAICEKFYDEELICRTTSEYVLSLIFENQLASGVWDDYYPLFNFPGAGSAYVYHFELLQAVVWTIAGNPGVLRRYLHNIGKVLNWVDIREIKHKSGVNGWSIMSDLQARFKPISWATIQVLYVLDRLEEHLGTVYRDLVFESMGADTIKTSEKAKPLEDIVDIKFKIDDISYSVKDVVNEYIVKPIASNDASLKRVAPEGVALANIFFGPPGSSKTSLARAISIELGWPILELDPSHFAPRPGAGLEMRIIEVFSLLEEVYDTVILLDEIEELVRERTEEGSTFAERLLTTLMLPRLNRLRDTGRSVVIVATNHIETFDEAARRYGRFDMVLPIGAPEVEGKLGALAKKLGVEFGEVKGWWDNEQDSKRRGTFKNLLFIELGMLVRAMKGEKSAEAFGLALGNIETTIHLKSDKEKEFGDTCKEFTRLP